jgi:hypothetical protein
VWDGPWEWQDAMSKRKKALAGGMCALGVALLLAVFALFRGYFDQGRFEVKEATWTPSGPARVALVAERSDHQALSSDVYFVLIGDHVFSPTELRIAYYSQHALFAAASDCLSARWADPHNLAVMCRDGVVDSNHIEVRKRQVGDVAITYVNIPDESSATE